jgi:ABC-type phosphate transport system ATPase subunit
MKMGKVFQTAGAMETRTKVEISNLAVFYGKFRALKEINLTVR